MRLNGEKDLYKKIFQITFLLLLITVEQRNLAASHLERVFEDIVDCRCLVSRAYNNGSHNLPPAVAEKYTERWHFCRFESVREAKENPRVFREKMRISEEDFSLKLGHIYRAMSDRTVIVFRGSVCSDEWVGDFGNLKGTTAAAMTLHKNVPGMVHEGFLRAVGQFCPFIEECMDIDAIRRPNHEILLTGHSRGAAFALLVAVRLQSLFQELGIATKNRIKVVTFSAPEKVIGDIRFWEHVDAEIGGINVIKIYSDLDPVPKINLGNFADYAPPQNVFAIEIPILRRDVVPAYAERMMGDLLRYQQQHPGVSLDLVTQAFTYVKEATAASVRFLHEMRDDGILEKGYKKQLPEYLERWIKEVYFPQKLPFISEVSQLCAEHLRSWQENHNDFGDSRLLVSEKVNVFLIKSEEISQNPHREEKRMRFVHFMIRFGINPIAYSPLLRNVEMDWRRSVL